jgi:hypothetical protein
VPSRSRITSISFSTQLNRQRAAVVQLQAFRERVSWLLVSRLAQLSVVSQAPEFQR